MSESLPDFALDLLDDVEAAELREHLDGCASCRQELHDLKAASHLLAMDLDPVAPPVELKAKLLAADTLDSRAEMPSLSHRPSATIASQNRFSWKAALPYLAASVCALALGWLVAQFSGDRTQVAENVAAQQQWQRQIDRARHDLGIPATRPVDWRATASGYERRNDLNIVAFDDTIAHQLHLVVAGVTSPPNGVRYYVWLMDADNNVITSARLDTTSAKVATGVADLPSDSATVDNVIVTAETNDSPTAPSDEVLASGRLAPE